MKKDDIKLIYYVIKKMGLLYMQDEIIDVAYIGYTKALKGYKKENSAFSTFAFKCIKNEILRYLLTENREKRRTNTSAISLNSKVNEHTEDEFIEFIPDDFDLEETIETKIIVENIKNKAKTILTERQYKIFEMRFVDELTLEEIATKTNMTRSNCGQIVKRILDKLKKDKYIQKLKEDK